MSLIIYPAGLPKPLQKGYGVKVTPNIVRDEGQGGAVGQRVLTYGNPQTVSCSIMLSTQVEYRTWLAFLKVLHDGNDWFLMDMLGKTVKCRLQSGKWSCSLNCRTDTKVFREIKLTLDVEGM